MIRMMKILGQESWKEANADVVALLETSDPIDGHRDPQEVAKTALAIAAAYYDNAERWQGWTFVREAKP